MKDRLARRVAYKGSLLTVNVDRVRLPNGHELELEFIEHPGASAVLPLHEDGSITLIRQYRYAAGGFILEAPAGKLDAGETPERCAARELREETGLVAGELTPLGVIHTTPGFTDERIFLYAATSLHQASAALEHDELVETVRMPLDDAVELVTRGQLTDGKTWCLLLRLRQEQAAGRWAPGNRP
jgi:ADP-ribose pyrophosphatase